MISFIPDFAIISYGSDMLLSDDWFQWNRLIPVDILRYF